MQRDGKIVVAGYTKIGSNRDFLVVRFDSSGEIDFYSYTGFGGDDFASAVAIDYNGSPSTNPLYGTIVAVGRAADDIGVLRLAPNGSFDDSFDGDGKVSTDFPGESDEDATGVVIQPGGRIVAIGTTVPSGSSSWDLAMARYLPDGSLDPTFGNQVNGKVVIGTSGADWPADAAMGLTGGFVVGGSHNSKQVVMAFTSDGALDTRFNGDGIVETNSEPVLAVATTGNLIAPVRRVVVGSMQGVSRFVDVGSVIGIGSFDPNAFEAGQNIGTILVGRTQPLNTTERVFVNFSGTARAPYLLNADYAVSGMTVEQPLQGPSYIDIPAGQTTASATIIPIDDTRNEGDETIVISLSDRPTYDIGTPSSAMLVIRDNDTVGGALVAPPLFACDSLPQLVRFTFNQDVSASIGLEDFTVTGASGPVPFGFSHDSISNTSTLTFTGVLADGEYEARALAAGILNPTGLPMPADVTFNFFVLAGDADRDGKVDVADLGILASNWQQSPRTFPQGDFDYSGTVDVNDLGILATRWQQSLSSAQAPVASKTRSLSRMIDGLF
jgi:uncharacterized delta-60 repeat protein